MNALPDEVKIRLPKGDWSPGFPKQADHRQKTAAIVAGFTEPAKTEQLHEVDTSLGLDDRVRHVLDGVRAIRERREEAMKAFAEEESELLLQCITAVVDPLCARVGIDLWTLIDVLKEEAKRRSPERKDPTQ